MIEDDDDPYKKLADAIVDQAITDYIKIEKRRLIQKKLENYQK